MRLFTEAPALRGLFVCGFFSRCEHVVTGAAPRERPYRLHRLLLVLATEVGKRLVDPRMPEQLLSCDDVARIRLMELNREPSAQRMNVRLDLRASRDLSFGDASRYQSRAPRWG